MPGEYFDIVLFADEVPIVEKRYVLVLPAGKRLHSEIYNGPLYSGTSYDEEATEYAWWGLDLPARVHEPSQPDGSDIVAKVVMATVESWEAKSRWFFDVNRNQFEVTQEIDAKVDEILRDAGVSNASDERKAETLVHWVAQNIRYSGQTMGEGEGFTLHPGSMIFEQRSGVCKDIAGMLITMMRAADLPSFAAMTMAGSRIEDVPADQFNHCVCALRRDDGTFEMYDPTWVPYNNDIWSLLETEQHYLVGTPEGESLSRIRYSPPEESPLRISHEAKLGDDGTLEGTFKLAGFGRARRKAPPHDQRHAPPGDPARAREAALPHRRPRREHPFRLSRSRRFQPGHVGDDHVPRSPFRAAGRGRFRVREPDDERRPERRKSLPGGAHRRGSTNARRTSSSTTRSSSTEKRTSGSPPVTARSIRRRRTWSTRPTRTSKARAGWTGARSPSPSARRSAGGRSRPTGTRGSNARSTRPKNGAKRRIRIEKGGK